jgi:hypothetical protein
MATVPRTDRVTVRLDARTVERIERISGARGIGKEGQFSETLRMAVRRGLAILERTEAAKQAREAETISA